jgi:hypothetical protein
MFISIPQHLQPRALDQGAGDRGHAIHAGDRRSAGEGHPSDREAAWASPEPRRRALVEMAVEGTLAYYVHADDHKLVVSRVFRTFGLAERHPVLAHAVMAPPICWS